jgi:hypothetical protein
MTNILKYLKYKIGTKIILVSYPESPIGGISTKRNIALIVKQNEYYSYVCRIVGG